MTEQITKLPKDWKWVKLNEICDKVSLNKIKIKQKQYLPEGKYPVIDQGQDLIGGYFNDEKLIVPNEPPYIIFGDHTKIKKFINFKFIPGADGVKVLKPKEIIEPKFLFYSLFTIKIEDKGYARHFQLLEKELFPLPPLETQQAIVSKIEELFSELDKGVEDLKTAQQQLKTYRQSVLKYAFEGKLTNKKVKDGELPKGWNIFKIGEVCKTIDGDRGPNYPKKEEFSKEGYCLYLSTKNVREDRFLFEETIFITKEKDEKLRSGKLQKNDVVITTRGTLGNVALYDNKVPFKHIRINSGMLILRIENENLNNYYLMKFITSPVFINQLKNMQTGTAQPQIPANILREIEIPIPPNLEEQHQIVQEIESRLSVADKMEESIAQSLQQAEALRQSILKKAFSGELV